MGLTVWSLWVLTRWRLGGERRWLDEWCRVVKAALRAVR